MLNPIKYLKEVKKELKNEHATLSAEYIELRDMKDYDFRQMQSITRKIDNLESQLNLLDEMIDEYTERQEETKEMIEEGLKEDPANFLKDIMEEYKDETKE